MMCFIILDDADFDLAVNAAVFGKFILQAQICMITHRLIVCHDLRPVRRAIHCPRTCLFGGEKNSRVGRFGGDWIIEEFTTDHWVRGHHTSGRYPF